jgi:hypothetical protein
MVAPVRTSLALSLRDDPAYISYCNRVSVWRGGAAWLLLCKIARYIYLAVHFPAIRLQSNKPHVVIQRSGIWGRSYI